MSTSKVVRCVAYALLVAVLAGCGSSDSPSPGPKGTNGTSPSATGGKKRIVFLINTPDPYWETCEKGLQDGAEKYELEEAGYTASQDPNDGTPEGQIAKLRQYATQPDIAAVAISPTERDNETIVDEMRKLKKKGVQVICVDNDVNREQFRDARSYYIGTDNVVGGRALGTGVKAILEAKGVTSGSYAQFVGLTDSDNARARMDGAKESLGDAYTEADRSPDQGDRTKALDTVRTALTNHKDLVALLGIWAYNAPAIAEVVKERGVRDKITIGTFDAQSRAIDAMEEGMIDVMVVQNPYDMGVQTVRLLKAMLLEDKSTVKEMFPNEQGPDGDIYTTGLRVVVPEENSPVKQELFDKKFVEFMTLKDFKAWLKERNLTDS